MCAVLSSAIIEGFQLNLVVRAWLYNAAEVTVQQVILRTSLGRKLLSSLMSVFRQNSPLRLNYY